jgi:hypothetical protein
MKREAKKIDKKQEKRYNEDTVKAPFAACGSDPERSHLISSLSHGRLFSLAIDSKFIGECPSLPLSNSAYRGGCITDRS